MAKYSSGQLGHSSGYTGLQTRIHKSTSSLISKDYKSPHRKGSEVGSSERSSGIGGQKSYLQDISSLSARILGVLLPSSKEDRRLAPNIKSQTAKSIHKTIQVSHGEFSGGDEVSSQSQVGNFIRLKRCLPSYTNLR
jgi:hypothetical protein